MKTSDIDLLLQFNDKQYWKTTKSYTTFLMPRDTEVFNVTENCHFDVDVNKSVSGLFSFYFETKLI